MSHYRAVRRSLMVEATAKRILDAVRKEPGWPRSFYAGEGDKVFGVLSISNDAFALLAKRGDIVKGPADSRSRETNNARFGWYAKGSFRPAHNVLRRE